MKYVIKKINKKYKKNILKLHWKVFARAKKTTDFWDWRFDNKFLNKPIGRVAILKEKIILAGVIEDSRGVKFCDILLRKIITQAKPRDFFIETKNKVTERFIRGDLQF